MAPLQTPPSIEEASPNKDMQPAHSKAFKRRGESPEASVRTIDSIISRATEPALYECTESRGPDRVKPASETSYGIHKNAENGSDPDESEDESENESEVAAPPRLSQRRANGENASRSGNSDDSAVASEVESNEYESSNYESSEYESEYEGDIEDEESRNGEGSDSSSDSSSELSDDSNSESSDDSYDSYDSYDLSDDSSYAYWARRARDERDANENGDSHFDRNGNFRMPRALIKDPTPAEIMQEEARLEALRQAVRRRAGCSQSSSPPPKNYHHSMFERVNDAGVDPEGNYMQEIKDGEDQRDREMGNAASSLTVIVFFMLAFFIALKVCELSIAI